MKQSIAHITLVVDDYDDAITFYCGKLGFELIEDSYQQEQDKRWVTVRPPGSTGVALLLARATNADQRSFVGNQSGGRVFLFLATDNILRDHTRMQSLDIKFVRPPRERDYGTVAVFEDLYGNLWDLVEFADGHPMGN